MASSRSSTRLTVRPVDAGTWNDFERLFESRGAPKHCWCMAWRTDHKDPRSANGPGRKSMMKERVDRGSPVGLLGYLGDEPVAWCSIAPFDTFQGLRKVDESMDRVWAVTCFFVLRAHRNGGLTKQMLEAAVKHARKHGARLVEGYGVDSSSPSYRHMGFVRMFEAAGFEEVAREGSRRHVMRRPTRRSSRPSDVPRLKANG